MDIKEWFKLAREAEDPITFFGMHYLGGAYVAHKYLWYDAWQPEKEDCDLVISVITQYLNSRNIQVFETETGSCFTRIFPWTDAKWYVEFLTDIENKSMLAVVEEDIYDLFPDLRIFKFCLYKR